MARKWNSHCPSCGGEVGEVTRQAQSPVKMEKHGRGLEWTYEYVTFACLSCGRQAQAMGKDIGTNIILYAWEDQQPMKPDTPNDPDGIDLQWRCDDEGCQVSYVDPETSEGVILAFPPETPESFAMQRARLFLYRQYGERVIKPEHRRGEYDTN